MSNERSAPPQRERPVPGHGAAATDDRAADPTAARAAEAVGRARLAAPRRSSRCAAQVVEGEAVLLDLQGRQLVGLNGVGSFVFELIDGAHDVTALAAAVAERFEVELPRAELDVVAFVQDLVRRGFVEVAEP
jgi:Coenzyme PQQ synthesis protein D (PqqD)